jgi:hypothetical protein
LKSTKRSCSTTSSAAATSADGPWPWPTQGTYAQSATQEAHAASTYHRPLRLPRRPSRAYR